MAQLNLNNAGFNFGWYHPKAHCTAGVTKVTGTPLSVGSTSYVHTALTNNVTYYYVIAAVDAQGEGADSVETSGRPASSKIMFATSSTHTGNLGGIAGANTICQTRATAAALGGSFRAYISTTQIDAVCNILGLTGQWAANCNLPYPPTLDTTAPVFNRGGQNLATNLFVLVNSNSGANTCGPGLAICNAVGFDEAASPVAAPVRSITTTGGVYSTAPGGNTACNDLTSAASDGIGVLYGTSYDTNNWWYSAGWNDNCPSLQPIFCIQQ